MMFSGANLPRIAVVYANNKDSEGAVIHATANTRHWKSYQAVAEDICSSLVSLGLDAVTMPDGVDLVERLRSNKVELVWLNTGGVQGECPLAQTPALLETAGVPYIGHSPLNAAMLDDKGLFKLACSGLGLPTAPFIVHNPAVGPLKPHKSAAFKNAFGSYQGPFIVKPVNGRASQNVEFVETLAQVPAMVASVAANTNTLVLVEKFLGGREYCIAVMGAGPAGAVAFSPVERHLATDEKVFTSMDVKAITADRVRAVEIDGAEAELVEQLQALGTAVYSSLNLTSLVRLDIRADEEGELYILEANPKPDLKKPSATSTSLVCTGLSSQMGWTYEDLITCLFVERLWQLEQHKPHMLAHFMPETCSAEKLLQHYLPERVREVLTPNPHQLQLMNSINSSCSFSLVMEGLLLEQLDSLTIPAAAGAGGGGGGGGGDGSLLNLRREQLSVSICEGLEELRKKQQSFILTCPPQNSSNIFTSRPSLMGVPETQLPATNGNDEGITGLEHDRLVEELQQMVELSMSPTAAVAAAAN